MGQMSGADADALERLGHQVEGVSKRMMASQARLTRSLHSSPWHGASADRFRHQWDGQYRKAMIEAAGFLGTASQTLRINAQQQRDASGLATPGRGPWANPSWSDRLRRAIDAGRREFERRLQEWQAGLSPWAATGISVAGLLVGGLPGLIVGMSLSTGASVPDVLRELGKATSDVARGENLTPRQKAFVNLCKSVSIIGPVIDLGVVAWDTGDVVVDVIRYGPDSRIVQQEQEHLYLEALDFGVGIITDAPPIEVPLNAVDLVFGTTSNDAWDSLTTPSGVYGLAKQATSSHTPASGGGW